MVDSNNTFSSAFAQGPGPVVIIGGLLIDDIAIAKENIRPHSSNPVFWRHSLGGVATNVARVVAQQLDTLLIANIGSDKNGEQVTQILDELAIPAALKHWPDNPTDRYCAVVTPDGDLYVGLADAQLVESMRWNDIEQRLPNQQPKAIVLDANLSPSCLEDTYAGLRNQYKNHVPICALTVSPVKSLKLSPYAEQIDLLLCNRREAAALAKLPYQRKLEDLADGLIGQGFNRFVISDASKPILIQDEQFRAHIPVDNKIIKENVNGAGDALAGATIAQLVLGGSLSSAVKNKGLLAANAVLQGDAVAPSL